MPSNNIPQPRPKILIVCGPTATGKTNFALELAARFNGELVSADSRQVYTGKNLVHGKDLPPNIEYRISNIVWRGRKLKYYEIGNTKVWLYDVVDPGEEFNVSFWRECANIVITDIHSRKKLPIVVGGTGLYLKSLTQPLSDISVPPDPNFRSKFQNKSPHYLFNYLNRLDPFRAARLNISDRQNPRRLIRAIEISSTSPPPPLQNFGEGSRRGEVLEIGLTAPREYLYRLVNKRVLDRISAGAAAEDGDLAANPSRWQFREHAIVRSQLTWFKKQPDISWFDISQAGWKPLALAHISNWYNKL